MGNRVGGAKHFSNIVHFESISTVADSAVTRTIEIEPREGHAIVIDQVRVVYRGLAGEETSSEVYGIVSVDENQAAVDMDDEDTIFNFAFSKDRTTTGISLGVMSDFIKFDRGLPTSSRALRLVVISDNASLSTHQLDCQVEYHYEPISRAMMIARGI